MNKYQKTYRDLHPLNVNDDHDCHAGPEDGCSGCSNDYPLGGMIEPYDIEKENNSTIYAENN